ncbi:hypothetical protein [Streptomyces sp. NWU339]|uniref:hypothetical protein n=1 Tax=Streptomyces sp. NWU339 TaxID=2185284 RepID=UPI00215ADBC0|nr:hypothetical protein [Streptomyces sp. NWU339]
MGNPGEFPDPATGSAADTADRRSLRAGLVGGGAVLAACAGLVLYGVLNTSGSDSQAEQRSPTASVTYEVTGEGTADITYQGRSETGQATVVTAATLPWRATVKVPLGQDPVVSIVLDKKGGQARCTLAVRGQHVQSATAAGEFGRATCTGTLPTQDKPPSG